MSHGDYSPSTYGDRIAEEYDSLYSAFDPAAIDRLAELAGEGPALELGIGTGRIALPLAARGVPVEGIDASQAMVDKLRAKPGGAGITVTVADFREFELRRRFSLIYIPFDTIFSLASQGEQISCFRSVAAHLRPGGCFVLEAFVPDLSRYDRGERVSATRIGAEQAELEVSRHDPVTQQIHSYHVLLSPAGARFFPIQLRYAWPSELDLMARLANLKLRDRWANWAGQSFGAASTAHISVYEHE
jgi:SAM-dependent methyltransferase